MSGDTILRWRRTKVAREGLALLSRAVVASCKFPFTP